MCCLKHIFISVVVNFCMINKVFPNTSVEKCHWEWSCPAQYRKGYEENSVSGGLKYLNPIISVPRIIVEDNEITPYREILPEVSLRLPEFEVAPVEVTCKSTQFAKNVRDLRKKIKCTPRPVLVDVVSSQGKVIPNKVATKLCSGMCTGDKSCLATKSTNISLSVRTEMDYGQIKCSTILVPQDLKCKCGCEEKTKNCLPNQIYMSKRCECQCKNEQEFVQCLRRSQKTNRHMWDPKKCICTCKNVKHCTTGSHWDTQECRCKHITPLHGTYNSTNSINTTN